MAGITDRYEVTKGCYVPVGTGVKFKPAGSIVTLDSVDAEELHGYVKKASKAKLKGRSKLNTPEPTVPESDAAVISTGTGRMVSEDPTPSEGEVGSDAGKSPTADGGAGTEAVQ